MSDRCGWCGGSGWVELRAWGETTGRRRCSECGTAGVRFAAWTGAPVHLVDPRWTPGPIRVVTDGPGRFPEPANIPTITVFCGPPAPEPSPPTPEEMLRAVGVEPPWMAAA